MSRASRRQFLRAVAAVPLPFALPAATAAEPAAADIGSRRELFVDDTLIDRLGGKATLRLHHPQPKEVALVHDTPWEGSGSGYHSVFRDGDRYRMYYKAWHLDVSGGKLNTSAHPLYCCYAESTDGVRWTKPELGLHEFRGSKANNIAIASGKIGGVNADAGHPAVFRDENPDAAPDARYKAILRSNGPHGLLAFQSADGLRWAPMADKPVITAGAFDSQNLAFWDPVRKEYRAYWRTFTGGVTDAKTWKPTRTRAIRTATSKDFLTWANQADLTYADSPPEHLYTNQVKPYHRAPHLLIGFPARYVERPWSDSMRALPEREHREQRSKAGQRYGTAITEGLLMASRDGVRFKRWNEAFLRPGPEREGTWNYGHQYVAWHLVETRSALDGAAGELSLYATESYWTGDSSALRRYTLRLDGFVSANAPLSGGELVTRPVTFAGSGLEVNFATSAAGSVRVELQDAAGASIPGYTLAECSPLFGDTVSRSVTWKAGGDVGKLAGKPVRLRFALADADLYAYRFRG
ncbi:MAG TPA: hypothetical protein VM533_15845 [Fimbriiglobus sp.]|jgi:hypothetical protein|nr:hypothetical protein [Fimbriiglobus sp.]